ncbi:MAG TPA: adenylate/guanylate cyclase domain-containing protein [Actinomycetota bacterium]|nr:adenylate/guanylate cyclase domain-containing protein [Actinomycetota bacterium]
MRACDSCGAAVVDEARFCPSCGAALRPETQLEERKIVTVLFADLVGSTELGERLEHERLRAILHSYFSAMSAAIEAWGGTVEKYVGDAILAVFGLPVTHEDDPGRAVMAGLDMVRRLQGMNENLKRRHGVELQVRVGINTGEVVAVAGQAFGKGIVLGDAANVAARVQSEAGPGAVVVTQRTHETIQQGFRFGDAVDVTVKGKSHSIRIYPVLAPHPTVSRGVPGLRSPMVGRSHELQSLLEALNTASRTKSPRFVLVLGPPGIGKSRLIQEFSRAVATSDSSAMVVTGRCPSAGPGTEVGALGEILRAVCGVSLDDTPAETADKIRAEVLRTDGGRTTSNFDRTVFSLAATAGVSLPVDPLRGLEPKEVAEELTSAWVRFLTAEAASRPVVVVVEDLHWATEVLLKRLAAIASEAGGPLVILGTARPEFRSEGFEFGLDPSRYRQLVLEPLSEKESASLVGELLSQSDLPPQLHSQVLAKSEGNPYFVEELLRRLIDEGLLVRDNGRWRATPQAADVTLPHSIHAVLSARIDALPITEKRALEEAAVIGRTFWQEPLERLVGDTEIGWHLQLLAEKGLVVSRPVSELPGHVEYAFRHALVHDVAYESVPKTRRARAHAEVGAWVEDLAGSDPDRFTELLAHHYGRAATIEGADLAWPDDSDAMETVRRKGFEASIAAGDIARRRFEVPRALELHKQALSLAANDDERSRVLEAEGDDHATAFRADESVRRYQEALELVRPNPSRRSDAARICAKVGMIAWKSGAFADEWDPTEFETLLHEGLAASDDDETRCRLLATTAGARRLWTIFRRPDPVPTEERIRIGEEARALADRLGNAELKDLALDVLQPLYWNDGRLDQLLDLAPRRLAVLDDIPSRGRQADLLHEVALIMNQVEGDFVLGLDLAMRSRDLSEGTSAHQLLHASTSMMEASYQLGRWDDLIKTLDEHLLVFKGESSVKCPRLRSGPLFAALALAHRGERGQSEALTRRMRLEEDPYLTALAANVHIALGEIGAGRESAEAAWRASSAVQDRTTAAPPLMEALTLSGEWQALEDLIEEIHALAAFIPLLRAMATRAQGMSLAAQGDPRNAKRASMRAEAEFDRLHMRFEVARTREAVAEVSDDATARELLEAALGTYEELRAAPHASRVRNALLADSNRR